MNMLRHNDESDDLEAVGLANLFTNLEKHVTRMCAAKQRLAPIAARGNEMQIPAAMNADQASGYGPALYKSSVHPNVPHALAAHPPNTTGMGTHSRAHYGKSKGWGTRLHLRVSSKSCHDNCVVPNLDAELHSSTSTHRYFLGFDSLAEP